MNEQRKLDFQLPLTAAVKTFSEKLERLGGKKSMANDLKNCM